MYIVKVTGLGHLCKKPTNMNVYDELDGGMATRRNMVHEDPRQPKRPFPSILCGTMTGARTQPIIHKKKNTISIESRPL